MKVRFCNNNKGKGGVIRQLAEEWSELDLKIKKCLGECRQCAKVPFARVNGELVIGRDGDELLQKIVSLLQQRGVSSSKAPRGKKK